MKYPVSSSLRHKGKALDLDATREVITLLGINGEPMGNLSWDFVIDQILAYRNPPTSRETRNEPRVTLTFRVNYKTPEGSIVYLRPGQSVPEEVPQTLRGTARSLYYGDTLLGRDTGVPQAYAQAIGTANVSSGDPVASVRMRCRCRRPGRLPNSPGSSTRARGRSIVCVRRTHLFNVKKNVYRIGNMPIRFRAA